MKQHSKKLAALVTIFSMTFSLTACGGKPASDQSSTADAGAEKSEEAISVEWRMANQHPDDSIATIADQEIIDAIEKATDGRVKITLYTNNSLGDYLSVFNEVMIGSIEMAHISTDESYDARLLGGFLPYLSTGYEQLPKVYGPDSYLFKTMKNDIYKNLGVEFMGFFCEGFDGVGTQKAINSPADIGVDKGVVIRVPGMQTFIEANLMLGFRESTIPYSDTYTALQTGLVEGASGVPANLFYLNFRDVITHFYDYQQVQEATHILINKDAFSKLSEADQKAISEIIQDKCASSYDLAKADEDKYKDLLKKEGIEVVEFTAEERKAFAGACHEQVWPKLAETFTQEFLDGCLADIK
ncbi:TRAP transporter substrate-binding protein DctP [Clostridium sp. AM58-1XD]|uniref:TRAP transporter substrate-binding protein DctP n=1 Tax=Clostridium sp. AM58-1XD TaxID=2292307 RepID=UPI000E476709|nr:TRAP transporter substrate-binding protein DctP [Clostridium sp. AM58-1XD]RGZ00456.1 hypothetical protein DXA13_05340 [Clostridium sp. AM58-1XD]